MSIVSVAIVWKKILEFYNCTANRIIIIIMKIEKRSCSSVNLVNNFVDFIFNGYVFIIFVWLPLLFATVGYLTQTVLHRVHESQIYLENQFETMANLCRRKREKWNK